MLLLGLCVAALVVGWLRLLTDRPRLPPGSSYSPQPDGAEGVYLWAEELGASPRRLQEAPLVGRTDQPPSLLLILQPEPAVSDDTRQAVERVAGAGGTVVLAGDSLGTVLLARDLGATLEALPAPAATLSPPDGSLVLASPSRLRVRAGGGTPLLVTPAGDAVAMRLGYEQGSLVVAATGALLSNEGLRDEATARFVYRQLLSGPAPNGVAFDEVHHSFAPEASASPSLDRLLLATAPGRAVLYLAALAFGFLLLGGRRLGPPIPEPRPTTTRRTMYEHVQMLAGLYRRAGRLSVARAAFARHYARHLARAAQPGAQQAALARIESARSEADLIAAVAAADDAR